MTERMFASWSSRMTGVVSGFSLFSNTIKPMNSNSLSMASLHSRTNAASCWNGKTFFSVCSRPESKPRLCKLMYRYINTEDSNRLGVLETWVLVSRRLETRFYKSWSRSWSWNLRVLVLVLVLERQSLGLGLGLGQASLESKSGFKASNTASLAVGHRTAFTVRCVGPVSMSVSCQVALLQMQSLVVRCLCIAAMSQWSPLGLQEHSQHSSIIIIIIIKRNI